MKRSTAIIMTIVASLACGLPSLIMVCIGAFALLGTQMPEVMASNPNANPGNVTLGAWMFICFGGVVLVIPILVGIFSFRLSASDDFPDNMAEPLS